MLIFGLSGGVITLTSGFYELWKLRSDTLSQVTSDTLDQHLQVMVLASTGYGLTTYLHLDNQRLAAVGFGLASLMTLSIGGHQSDGPSTTKEIANRLQVSYETARAQIAPMADRESSRGGTLTQLRGWTAR